MAIVDANIAREIAEQNPELHQMRQTAFGTDYLKDIEQGTGTAQYYGGWGNVPGYGFTSTTAAEPEVATEIVAPGVTAPVAGDQGQGTMPMTAQPTTTDYLGGATEGTSTIGNLANLTTPTTVGPFDYTDAAVTVPALDLSGTSEELIDRGVIETPQEWYARTYGDSATASAPYGIGPNFPADYESLDNEERAIIDQEYTNAYGINTTPESSLIDKAKDKLSGGLENILNLGAAAISPIGTIIQKGMDAIPESKSQIEYESYDPAQKQAIDEAYGTGGIMEGYNPVSIAGEGVGATVEKRLDDINKALANPDRVVRDDVYVTDKDGNKIFNPSYNSLEKQKARLEEFKNKLNPQPVTYVQDPDTGDAKIAEKIAAEKRAADAPDIYTILGEEEGRPKYSEQLGLQPDNWRDKIDINVQSNYGGQGTTPDHIGFDYDQVKKDQEKAIEYALTGDLDVLSDIKNTEPISQPAYTYTYEGSDEQDRDDENTYGGVDAGTANIQDYADTYDPYSAPVDDPTDRGGGGGGGGGKIVCTMMNETYGFGNFRNKIWLRQSKNLAPEYQKGYHILFLPLVRLSKTNMVIRKILEHIAVHRTIDIRQEARGKKHLLGRIYRKILEPICYWVGKYAKR